LIERSFQELSGAVKTMRIIKELIEIWPNEVCDTVMWVKLFAVYIGKGTGSFLKVIKSLFSPVK